MCRRCFAEENRPPSEANKTSLDDLLLTAYRHFTETLQKFEKEAEQLCIEHGMYAIMYWLASADESPLTRPEKERLKGKEGHGITEGNWAFPIAGGLSGIRILTKYREHPAVRDKINARLDELAARHKRFRHGTRHGVAALRYR